MGAWRQKYVDGSVGMGAWGWECGDESMGMLVWGWEYGDGSSCNNWYSGIVGGCEMLKVKQISQISTNNLYYSGSSATISIVLSPDHPVKIILVLFC